MTNLTNKVMMAVATLALAGAASAQTVKADIPFSFRVGDKMMAPGPYLVEMNTRSGIEVFKVYNVEERDAALALSNVKHDPAKDWRADGKPRLSFECTSTCALAEIWTGGASDTAYRMHTPKKRAEDVRVAIVVAQPVKAD